MIRTFLRLMPKEGMHQAVVNLFERRRIPARSMALPGCLGVELGVATEPAGGIVATALWASREAYEGWLATDGRADDLAELMPLLVDGPDAVGPPLICEIVLSGSSAG